MKKRHDSSGSAAYAKAGVNLNAGDIFSDYASKIGQASQGNSKFVEVVDHSRGHFRGPRGFRFVNCPPDYFQEVAPDGIGTKTIVITAGRRFSKAVRNLVAMTRGDETRHGGLGLIFVNVLEAKTLGEPGSETFHNYKSMMDGLGETAKDQGFVIVGGETAEMGVCVSSEIPGSMAFNWSAVMIGINHPDMLIDGSGLKHGRQCVMALRDGFRSNGYSLARRCLAQVYGEKWWENADAKSDIAQVGREATLYDLFLTTMNGWHNGGKAEVKATLIAHLSGGGIVSKFADVLTRLGFSAVLNKLWMPPSFMSECVRMQKLPDKEAYKVFNGGQGALVVIDEEDALTFVQRAKDFGIEARDAGYIDVKRRDPRVIIRSQFSGEDFTVTG